MNTFLEPIQYFLFLVPDDAPSSLKESERTYNKIEVKWKTCLSWNGPQIGFELTALGKKDGVTHEISKPMVYVINFVQNICSVFGCLT